jgi:hypothetical protein
MKGSAKGAATAQLHAIAFPFNVYACAIKLEEGQPGFLHYGLYETSDMPFTEAQRRSTELLWRHLPPPCRLIEIGYGVGREKDRDYQ